MGYTEVTKKKQPIRKVQKKREGEIRMKMQGVTMWEMNLGFRPKDFQSVWGAIIQKNSPLAAQNSANHSDSRTQVSHRAGNLGVGSYSF